MKTRSPLLFLGLTGLASLLSAPTSPAQIDQTWLPGGPDNLWNNTSLNWDAGAVWTDNNNAIFGGAADTIDVTVPTIFNNLTFDSTGYAISSTGAGSLILGNDLASTITVTNAADSASIAETIADSVLGSSSLTKAGPGTLTLNGTAANTFYGGTIISAGTLTATHEGALGSGPVTNNAILNISKANVTFSGLANAMSGNGVTNVTALGTGSNTVALNGNYSAYTGTWNIGTTTVAGAGKVQMNGADNAATTINILTNATVFTSAGTHNAAAVLNGGDTGEVLGQLRVEGTAVWAGPITLAGAMTGTDSFIGANGGSGTFSGVIGESGGAQILSKGGAGTSILSALNTYSGGTVVRNGAISVSVLNNTGSSGNVGTGSTISLGNAATAASLIYTGVAGEITDRVINLAGTTGGVTLNQSGTAGTLTFSSALTATGAGIKTLTLTGSTAAIGELAGAVVNSSANTALTKTGTGTWVLGGSNTYSGATAVNNGTLRLNYATNNNSKLSDTAALTLGGGTVELAGGSHPEVVLSTALTAGTTNFISQTGGSSVLRLNTITPNAGSSLLFNGSGLADTDTLNTNGILGFWARVNAGGVSSWATNSTNAADGPVTAYTGYTDVSRFLDGVPAGTIPNGATNNVRVVNGGTTGDITLGGGALTQAYTLQNDSSGATIAAGADTEVLNVGADTGGVIWQTAGAGSLVIGKTAGNGVLTSGASVSGTAANLRIINDSTVNSLTVNSAIANNFTDVVGLTKSGNGVLVLNGNNTYTGATLIGSGSAVIGGGGTLILTGNNTGATGNVQAGNGATLILQSANALGTTGVASSQLQLFNGSNLKLQSDSSLTFNGTNGIGALNNATVGIDVNQLTAAGTNNVLTISPGITAVGNAVTLNFTGANGYNVAAGTFQSVTGGGTNLTLNPTTTTLSIVGYSNQNNAANSSTLTLSGTALGNTVSGVIANQGAGSTGTTGTVAVTKNGTGTWELQGANTHTGTTTVALGSLTLSGNRTATAGAITVGSAGNSATLNVQNGTFSLGTFTVGTGDATSSGTVNHTAGSLTVTGTQMILGNAGVLGNASTGTYNLSGGTLTGSASANRGIIIGTNPGTTGIFNLSGTGTLAMGTAAVMIGRSDSPTAGTTGTFTQSGAGTSASIGTLTIGGGAGAAFTNTTGTLNVTAGTFTANAFTFLAAGESSTAVINIGGTADVTLPAFPTARGAGSTATINFDGGTLRPLAASPAYMGGLTNALIKTGGAKIDVATGRDIAITQNLLTDGLSLGGGLTKTGNGSLSLAGASTYTGGTTVSAGTLLINNTTGSGTGTGSVTVAPGATLGGSGSVGTGLAGTTLEVNGSLAPGNSPGLMTSNIPVNLNLGSLFAVEANSATAGTGYDQLLANSTVNIASTSVFQLTLGYAPAMGETFTFINLASGSIGGTFSNLPNGGTYITSFGGDPYEFATSYSGGTGNDLVLTAGIPEPGTFGILALAAFGTSLRRRRA